LEEGTSPIENQEGQRKRQHSIIEIAVWLFVFFIGIAMLMYDTSRGLGGFVIGISLAKLAFATSKLNG